MKNIKNVVSLVLIVLFTTTVKPQQKKPMVSANDKIAKKQTDRMTSYLNLDAHQQEKVFNLNKIMNQKRASLSESKKAWTKGGRELSEKEKRYLKQMQSQDRLLMQQRLKEILTPQQYKKWEAKRKRARNYLKNKGFSSGKRNQKTKRKPNKNQKTYYR